MTSFIIALLVLSSIAIAAIVAIYIKYWSSFKVILKSTMNEMSGKTAKSSILVLVTFSLFFGALFGVVISSSQTPKNLDMRTQMYSEEYNFSEFTINASEVTTSAFWDFDESTGSYVNTGGYVLSDESVNGNYDSQNETIYRDKINVEPGSLHQELYDEEPSISYLEDFPTYTESSPIYQFGNDKGDGNDEYKYNSYLYVLDYVLSQIQQSWEETLYTFDYSFQAVMNIMIQPDLPGMGYFEVSVDGHVLERGTNVQIVSIPDANSRNTNSDGALVDQFIPHNSDYQPLEDGEAYVVDYEHETYSVDQGSQIKIKNTELSVKDVGESSDYLYPISQIPAEYLLYSQPDSWIDTDNIVIYVNEDTFTEIVDDAYKTRKDGYSDSVFRTNMVDVNSDAQANVFYYKFKLSFDNIYEIIGVSESNYYSDNLSELTISSVSSLITKLNEELQSYGLYFKGTNSLEKVIGFPSVDYAISALAFSNTLVGYSRTGYSTSVTTLSSISSIFLIFIFILGIVVIMFIISRTFKRDIKWMGTLKSLGYSQSTISLLVVSKVIFYLILGTLIALATLPLFSLMWAQILGASVTSIIPIFGYSWIAIAFLTLVPFSLFTAFSFVVMRFYYIKIPALELIGDVENIKPNKSVQLFDKKYSGKSFKASYSVKNMLRLSTKSTAVMLSITAISFFMLLPLAVQTMPENTANNLVSQFSVPGTTLYTDTFNTDTFGGEKSMKKIELNDFYQMVDDGEITDYDFGRKTNEVNWDSLSGSATSWCNAWNDNIVAYVESADIANKYISNDSYFYLKSAIESAPSDLTSCGTDTPKYFSELSNSFIKYLDGGENTVYESFMIQHPESIGIALGYEVYDSSTHNFNQIFTSVEFNSLDNSIKYSDSLMFVNTDFIENGFQDVPSSTQNEINYFIETTTVPNGQIDLFYTSNTYADTIFESTGVNTSQATLTMPKDAYSYQPDYYYMSVEVAGKLDIPYFSTFYINIDDPDLRDPEVLGKNIDGNDDEKPDGVLGNVPDKLLAGENLENNFVWGTAYYGELLTTSESSTFKPSIAEMGQVPVMATTLNTGSYKSVDSSVPSSISGNDEFSYDYYGGEIITLADIVDPTDTKYEFTSSPYLFGAGTNSAKLLEVVFPYIYDVDPDKINEMMNNHYEGLAISTAAIISTIVTPGVAAIQNSIIPLSIMTAIIAMFLVALIMNEIFIENKKNTNIFKTLGYSSSSSTAMNYSSYTILFLIGWAIAIPIMFIVNLTASAFIGMVDGLANVVIFPQLSQIFLSFLIIIGIILLLWTISYLITKNFKPKTSMY